MHCSHWGCPRSAPPFWFQHLPPQVCEMLTHCFHLTETHVTQVLLRRTCHPLAG